MNSYLKKALRLGLLVDQKQAAYGNSVDTAEQVLKVYLKPYQDVGGDYIIPAEMLRHLLLIVRILDKLSRIFASPGGDMMNENPYQDIAGYGLLGITDD